MSFDQGAGGRINDAEALGTLWTAISGSATSEVEFVYQNTKSVSFKVKNSENGVKYYNSAASTNFTTNSRTWLAKLVITSPSNLSNTASTSMIAEIGSGNRANYYRYYIATDTTYPAAESWLIVPINPNISQWRDATVLSPSLTAVDYFALAATMKTSTAKSENTAMDAIDFMDNGTGLTLVGGDGADADGVFQDFVSFDEGTTANRYGVVQTKNGILYIRGMLTIGTATETDFTDSAKTLVFPHARVTTGFCGIKFGLQHASSVIDIKECTFIGRGALYTSDDTRPQYTVTGTSGTLTMSDCAFRVFDSITLTSKATLTDCIFADGRRVIQGTTSDAGTITSGVFSGCTGGDGVAYLFANDLTKISKCDFTFSDGHAIEVRPTGAGPFNYTFDGNVFTGYGANDTNDAALFINPVTSSANITIDVTNGLTPTRRLAAGYTGTYTVNNNVTATITVKDVNAVAVSGARVSVRRDSDNEELLGGVTNASGQVTGSLPSGAGAVTVKVRKGSGGGTDYIPVASPQTVGTSAFNVTVTVTEDTNNAT